MDCNPSGSSVHGILQARIPEWVAIPFSRGSNPGSPALQSDPLPSEPPGKPISTTSASQILKGKLRCWIKPVNAGMKGLGHPPERLVSWAPTGAPCDPRPRWQALERWALEHLPPPARGWSGKSRQHNPALTGGGGRDSHTLEIPGWAEGGPGCSAAPLFLVRIRLPWWLNRSHWRHRLHPWVREILWRRARQPTPGFSPGESHGQRSLAGYSPRSRKESDMTEVA